jgi:hypothetical protein
MQIVLCGRAGCLLPAQRQATGSLLRAGAPDVAHIRSAPALNAFAQIPSALNLNKIHHAFNKIDNPLTIE